ncbi:MAG: S8 family serine peptidase [Promethearchaeota archaeon]
MKNKKLNILSILLVSIILTSITPSITLFGNYSQVKVNPKLSAAIDITSPVEGMTYTPHMKGYYPATFGFECDDEDDDPTGWTILEEGGDCSVKSGVGDHLKVMGLESAPGGRVRVYQTFDSAKASGTIEAWIRSDSTTKVVYFLIQQTWHNSIHFAMSENGYFRYYDGSWHNIMAYNADQWYHIRIKFDCGSDWHLWIDGDSKDEEAGYNFRGSPSSMVQLFVSAEGENTNCYVDAVGYDWDPSYKIGINFPMEGYYLSKFGFECDDVDDDPTGWTILEEGGDCSVKSGVGDHLKVMGLESAPGGRVRVYQTFDSAKASGTIEAWIRSDSTTKVVYFLIQQTWHNSIHFAMSENGYFRYYDGSWHNIMAYNADQWYHIRIKFDCSSDWHLWIDGISKDGGSGYNFRGSPSSMVQLFVSAESENTNCYVDAVGYDWDLSYEVGDNRHEGLLLDIDPKGLGTLNYQLDLNQEVSFSDATVIPFPQDGSHTITVSGGGHTPDTVSFNTSVIDIISPVDGAQIQQSDDGYYPATYGFESDDDDISGTAIDFIDDQSAYGYCQIKAQYSGHKKVLYVKDALPGTGMKYQHYIDESKSIGTIEYWFVMTDLYTGPNDQILFHSLDSSDKVGFYISAGNGKFQDAQGNNIDMAYNYWYHIKIIFDTTAGNNGQYNWWVNGVEQESGVEMMENSGSITKLVIHSYSTNRGEGYFDAFGFDWDSSYEIGDNLYEGLLLNFEPDDSDWMGYTYDGQSLFTLYGDKVVPFTVGAHSIQLIGKIEADSYCCSNLVYYSVYHEPIQDLERHWGLTEIDVDDVWNIHHFKGDGVKVLIIDTGIDTNHQDLFLNYKGGYDFFNNDPFPEDPTTLNYEKGHGTSCAGIIAAIDNNFGGIGVAPEVDLYMARISNDLAQKQNELIHEAILWGIDQHPTIDNPFGQMDVISMSLAYYGDDANIIGDITNACEAAYNAGTVLVASSANTKPESGDPLDDPSWVRFPANLETVIAVGAINEQLERPSWSCYGNELDLVAPGINIYTTELYGAYNNYKYYGSFDGTSAACPIVAGVCALILSAKPNSNLTPLQIKTCLCATASYGGATWDQYYGWGIVNAKSAVDYAILYY